MPELDWVNARLKCSVFEVFSQLRSGVQDDIDKRNHSLTPDARMNFKMRDESAPSPDRFAVVRLAERASDALEFTCTDNSIYVKTQDGKTILCATPTLNESGECRLKTGEEELELWQFRLRALEDLFRF